MKLVIDIEEKKVPQFMALIKTHKIVDDVKRLRSRKKNRFLKGLAQSFKEVKLYQEGKIELNNAKDFLNELRSQKY